MFIKDDCPSADVASQTNYDFQQPTPQTVIRCHGALKGTKVAKRYRLGLRCMGRHVVSKFRKRQKHLQSSKKRDRLLF